MGGDRPCPVCENGPMRRHCEGTRNTACNWMVCLRRDCRARVDWGRKLAIVDRGAPGWATLKIA